MLTESYFIPFFLSSVDATVFGLHGALSFFGSMRGKPRRGMLRRAVFSDFQRKGLERIFQKQKYISKPDRKKLADKLGLKDSQVSMILISLSLSASLVKLIMETHLVFCLWYHNKFVQPLFSKVIVSKNCPSLSEI